MMSSSPWTSRQGVDPGRQLVLLEAVELYGFGNWQDSAVFAGDERGPEEMRDQYVSVFVDGNIGRVTWSSIDKDAFPISDHTSSGQAGQLSPSLTTPLPSIPEVSLSEQQCLGYMPRRDDFEREFDNEVELLISNLRINPNEEDDLDVDLKVAHIDIYNRRLKERFRKKSLVRDYGLVALFFKTLSKDPEWRALCPPSDYPPNDYPTGPTSDYPTGPTSDYPTGPTSDYSVNNHPKDPINDFSTGCSNLDSSPSLASTCNTKYLQSSSASSRLDMKSFPTKLDMKSASSRLDMKSASSRLDTKSASSRLDTKPVKGVGCKKKTSDTNVQTSPTNTATDHLNRHCPPSPRSPSLSLPSPTSKNRTLGTLSTSKNRTLGTLSTSKNRTLSTSKNGSVLTPKQREALREKFRIFSQFHSALDQLQLFHHLGREKELKSRIKELYRFRRNGLKSLHEVVSYELARTRNRGKKKKGLIAMKQMEGLEKKLKKERSPSPKRMKVSKTGEREEKKSGVEEKKSRVEEKKSRVEEKKSREASPSKQKTPTRKVVPTSRKVVPRLTDPEVSPFFPKDQIQRSSVLSPNKVSMKSVSQNKNISPNKVSMKSVSQEKIRSLSQEKIRSLSQEKIRSLSLNRERFGSIFSDSRDGRSPKGSVETTTLSGDDEDTVTDNDELLSESSNSRISCFNIDSMPGARLLSKSEKKMCENLRLTPSFYINVKGMIIKEKSGPLTVSRRQRNTLDSVDGRIRRRVNDYLSRSGMLC